MFSDAVFRRLVEEFQQEFPSLVMEISGPWVDRHGQPKRYICNFKDYTAFLNQVHSGESAETPEAALFAGLLWLREHYNAPV